jgi:methylenetetrahydrofolate dehydrogenase (NADP+)/methenyltetrahydrofolate cyclohydrolase
MGSIIDGKAIAAKMRKELTNQISELLAKNITPKLDVILVGDDEASASYLRSKKNACQKAGILFEDHLLPKETSMSELKQLIESLNQDATVHGIMLELPLPKGLNAKEAVRGSIQKRMSTESLRYPWDIFSADKTGCSRPLPNRF